MNAAFGAQADPAHENWDALAVGYALSALEPDEHDRFATHLIDCERCQLSVAQVEAVGASMGSSFEAPAPSSDLRSRVLSAAEQARPSVPVSAEDDRTRRTETFELDRDAVRVPRVTRQDTPRGPRHGSRRPEGPTRPGGPADRSAARRRWSAGRVAPWLVSVAAAVVVAVLAVTSLNLAADRDRQKSVAADRAAIISSIIKGGPAEVVPLKDNNGDQIATVVAQSGRVSVLPEAMQENSASSVYVLWGLKNSKDLSPTALGTFDVRGSKVEALSVANDLRGQFSTLRTFAVSHEQGRTAPTSPTDVVATGSA